MVTTGRQKGTYRWFEYPVFTAKGTIPGSLQALNTAVWQEWFPKEGQKYRANGTATLEVYSVGNPQSPDYESGIRVPVQGIDEDADNGCEAAEIVPAMMVTGIL